VTRDDSALGIDQDGIIEAELTDRGRNLRDLGV